MEQTEATNVRKLAYALLLTVAAGMALGRVLAVEFVLEPSIHRPAEDTKDKRRAWPARHPTPMPTFSSNDRSRWATVRALVEGGTYVIGRRDRALLAPGAVSLLAAGSGPGAVALSAAGYYTRINSDSGLVFDQDGWQTVDKVMNPATLEYYSSKPPLFSTMVAGLYWLLAHVLGWRFPDDTFSIVRTILLLVNVLPFLIYLKLFAGLVDRFGATDWGRLYAVTAACFATLVTPFLVTLNNHTVATFCTVFTLYPALRIWSAPRGESPPGYLFALTGLFASFTACNELPAAAFAANLALALLIRYPLKTAVWFLPAALVPLASFLLTNYLALGQLRPAYSEFGGPWYEYEGSYWITARLRAHGIDFARMREGDLMYFFHFFVGHHGLFSLTPIWVLAAGGTVAGLAALRNNWAHGRQAAEIPAAVGPLGLGRDVLGMSLVYPMTLMLTVLVVGFYLVKSDNYGGWTAGLRWLMWLSPLWLLCMLPALDWLAPRRWGRWLGYLLLAVSVLSASFPAWNPWRHPWLYRYLDAQGWIPY